MYFRTLLFPAIVIFLVVACDSENHPANPTEPVPGIIENDSLPDGTINLVTPKPGLITETPNGSYLLTAEKGIAVGARIKFMPEFRAYGWFTGVDRVEWQVQVKTEQTYDVFLEWSVSNEDAGKDFILETQKGQISGQVEKSGSWEQYKSKKIGQLRLESGRQQVVFKAKRDTDTLPLLDLRKIMFIPVK